MKRKEVKLEDITVTIQVLKYGKLKKIISRSADVVVGAMELLNIEDDKELSDGVIKFVKDNITEVEGILLEFTDLTPETIEEIYITEFPILFEETLSLYGLKKETIIDFFTQKIPQRNQVTQSPEETDQ
jgi:hypothetical protein